MKFHSKSLLKTVSGLVAFCTVLSLFVFCIPISAEVVDEYDLKTLLENGGTASLGADIELYETVFVYQDVTLDLCGHTVSVVKGTSTYDMIAFDGAKTLTVTDSVGGGALDATNALHSAICANNGGTVTITGGTVCKGKSLYGLNVDGGQIVISGGRFDFDPTSYLASGYTATA